MEKMDREMDEQLKNRAAELAAGNDETGDGRLDAADLKAQLNRIEAQLELQDRQNRQILRSQKLRTVLTVALSVVLLVFLGLLWYRMDTAYDNVMAACTQVNELAATVQSSLAVLDQEELNAMMDSLPEITEQLKSIDVDALNEVLEGLPALMENVSKLQAEVESITAVFGNLGSLLG